VNNLLKFYQNRLNLPDVTFHEIEHEDAIVATVYKVSLLDGRQYILKVCHRSHDFLCESYFLSYFKNIIPVPQIIDLIEPSPDIPGAILMEYLQGDLLKKSMLTDKLTYEIGSLLAKIHKNKTTGYGDLTNSAPLSSDPTSYFIFKFEEGIAECKDHLPKRTLDQCQDYFSRNINLLQSVDGPCMTHRDFRPGNILLHEGKIQGIIDWSSARGSFAEEDFCSLETEDWFNDINIKKSFLDGYASIRPVPNFPNIMPLLLLSKAIATIGFTIKSHTSDTKNKELYQRHFHLLTRLLIS
jgi:Ser/Thr protein kinase RdoA (MazF antagonist)